MVRPKAIVLPWFILVLAWVILAIPSIAYAAESEVTVTAEHIIPADQSSDASSVKLSQSEDNTSASATQTVSSAPVQESAKDNPLDLTSVSMSSGEIITMQTENSDDNTVSNESTAELESEAVDAALEAQADLAAASDGQVEMYRLYNPNSGEHFYTSTMSERVTLVSLGWRWEGVGWIAPVSSSAPVYRLYNPIAGDHHYTLSADERNQLKQLGWNYEGVGWYSDTSKTVEVLREYNMNATTGSHNFTTSAEEDAQLVAAGWNREGIAWYALDYGYGKASYIYLDAGHGWGSSSPGVYDPGAGGNGYVEAEQTAELVNLTAQYARDLYGISVYSNVDSGVQYWDRQADAASRNCTSFVSIHFNASDSGGTGTESYIHSSYAAAGSETLQSIMHEHLVAGVQLRDRGMKQAALSVCNGSNTGIPATLLEVCFIDNSYDMQVYKTNEDRVARELAKGLAEAVAAGF